MANLILRVVPDDKKITQTITLPGKLRNALLKEADRNGLSLSAQITMSLNRYMESRESIH